MADLVPVVLRFLHILFGVAWIGAVFYAVSVLRRALPKIAMPARKEVIKQLLRVAIRYVPIMAVLTIAFGAVLYLVLGEFDPDMLVGSSWGQTIFAAMLLTLATFAFGMAVVIRAGKRILSHANKEKCDHVEAMGGLQRTFNRGQVVVFFLGLTIIALMVLAPPGH